MDEDTKHELLCLQITNLVKVNNMIWKELYNQNKRLEALENGRHLQ